MDSLSLLILAVMLETERKVISLHRIQHIVRRIKELSDGCDALQPDIAI